MKLVTKISSECVGKIFVARNDDSAALEALELIERSGCQVMRVTYWGDVPMNPKVSYVAVVSNDNQGVWVKSASKTEVVAGGHIPHAQAQKFDGYYLIRPLPKLGKRDAGLDRQNRRGRMIALNHTAMRDARA